MTPAPFLCLALIFVSTWTSGSAQCTDLVTPQVLLTQLSRTSQLSPPGEGTNNNLRVLEFYTSCIASGSFRGSLTEASHFVKVNGTPGDGGIVYGIVDLSCSGSSWILNVDKPFETIENQTIIDLLSTNSSIQTDCWHCNAVNHFRHPLTNDTDDRLRHCDRKKTINYTVTILYTHYSSIL